MSILAFHSRNFNYILYVECVLQTNALTSKHDCRMETQGSCHLQTVQNQDTAAAYVLKLTRNVHYVGTITILNLSYFKLSKL